jgi:beta-N-acetylhexosaminidase
LGLPIITKSLQELKKTELVPFQKPVVQGEVASIMMAHISLPNAFGAGDEPTSISSDAMDYLRNEMKFEGVIVTDCLEMRGVTQYCGSTEVAAVQSIVAGADIAMICHTFSSQEGAVKGLWKAFEEGKLKENGLKKCAERIARLKDKFVGTWDDVLSMAPMAEASMADMLDGHKKLSEEIYEKCCALVRDPKGILPFALPPSKSMGLILLYVPIMEKINPAVDDSEGILRTKDNLVRNTAGPSYESFGRSLAKRSEVKQIVYSSGQQINQVELDSCNAIIFVTRNASRGDGWQNKVLTSLHSIIGTTKNLVVISSCDPFDIRCAGVAAYVCTFEYTAQALETAAAVIFGEIEPQGIAPVKS